LGAVERQAAHFHGSREPAGWWRIVGEIERGLERIAIPDCLLFYTFY
jgi:hypothetical protein